MQGTVIRPVRMLQLLWITFLMPFVVVGFAAPPDAWGKVFVGGIMSAFVLTALLGVRDHVELRDDCALLVTTRRWFVVPATFEIRPLRDGVRELVILPFNLKVLYSGSHRVYLWMYGTRARRIIAHAHGQTLPPSRTSTTADAALGSPAAAPPTPAPRPTTRPQSTGKATRPAAD